MNVGQLQSIPFILRRVQVALILNKQYGNLLSLGLESPEEQDRQDIDTEFVYFCTDIEKEIYLERLAGTVGKATRSQDLLSVN